MTIERLIELWRPKIAPAIPLSVLLAFIYWESGGNFEDATHGTGKQKPPYSQPLYYELGSFQTPAGLHGKCRDDQFKSCDVRPPGREIPGGSVAMGSALQEDWRRPQDWKNPATQIRVGLLNLKEGADRIRSSYPDLFPTTGSEWYIRAAVLLPFARGSGFTRSVWSRR